MAALNKLSLGLTRRAHNLCLARQAPRNRVDLEQKLSTKPYLGGLVFFGFCYICLRYAVYPRPQNGRTSKVQVVSTQTLNPEPQIISNPKPVSTLKPLPWQQRHRTAGPSSPLCDSSFARLRQVPLGGLGFRTACGACGLRV